MIASATESATRYYPEPSLREALTKIAEARQQLRSVYERKCGLTRTTAIDALQELAGENTLGRFQRIERLCDTNVSGPFAQLGGLLSYHAGIARWADGGAESAQRMQVLAEQMNAELTTMIQAEVIRYYAAIKKFNEHHGFSSTPDRESINLAEKAAYEATLYINSAVEKAAPGAESVDPQRYDAAMRCMKLAKTHLEQAQAIGQEEGPMSPPSIETAGRRDLRRYKKSERASAMETLRLAIDKVHTPERLSRIAPEHVMSCISLDHGVVQDMLKEFKECYSYRTQHEIREAETLLASAIELMVEPKPARIRSGHSVSATGRR